MLCPILTLNASITVAIADFYADGTLWFALRDSEGRRAQVCIDGRELSPTRFRLFDQARHPRKPEAVLIDLGALEESIIIPLISRWLDSGSPKSLGLTEYGWELIRDGKAQAPCLAGGLQLL
jgi:hypothetical protein